MIISFIKSVVIHAPTFQKSTVPVPRCFIINSQAFASYVGAEGNGGRIFAGLLKGISQL
jgi:hypothetical protein